MKGATLHHRLGCGATPRRCWPTSVRRGSRVCVIIPSKDNASGSSGKRVPLLWTTLSDPGGLGVLKRKQVLEEMYSRDAPEPYYEAGAAAAPAPATSSRVGGEQAQLQEVQQQQQPDREHGLDGSSSQQAQQQQQDLQHAGWPINGRAVASGTEAAVEGEDSEEEEADMDLSLLRERIASAALASTSARSSTAAAGASAFAIVGAEGASARMQHRRQLHQRLVSAPVASCNTVSAAPRGLDGTTDGPEQSHQRHASERERHDPQHHHHHHSHHGSQAQQHLNGDSAIAASTSAAAATGRFSEDHLAAHHQLRSQQQPQMHHTQQQQQHQPHQHANGNGLHQASLLDDQTSQFGARSPAVAAEAAVEAALLPAGASPAAGATAAAATAPLAVRGTSIPGSIWILCCISAALTCASCVFNTALPIYMVSELKMSMRSMGMFEGFLEAFSYVVRMCSGVVSDRMTSRKAAITLGFAAGAAAKFGMASAGSVGVLFAGKAVDRLANGIQAAPRDALIGDLSPSGVRSACFGLAQSLRKWGSAVGALAAFFLMKASNNNYQLIFYSASAVSLVACLAFVLFVPAHTREPTPSKQAAAAAAASASAGGAAAPAAAATAAAAPSAGSSGFLSGVREFSRSVMSMGVDFYRMLGVISLYALGHINESLLEARAMEVGFGKAEATLVVAAIAAVTFLTAYPLGQLDDRYGAGTTFAVGIGALIAGDLVLLLSGPHPLALFASCLFLGVHWAVIQGPLLSIVSGLAPPNLRGTAFGIFYTVMAFTAVAANTMYGSIWHTYGANAAFATSAALMAAVLTALPYMLPASSRRGGAAAAAATATVAAPSPVATAAVPPAPGPLASLGVSMPSLSASGDGNSKASGLVGSPLPAAA